MTLLLRTDGVLEIEGEVIMLTTAVRVRQGDASLDRQKVQGRSGSDLTFDGWASREVEVEGLIPAPPDDAEPIIPYDAIYPDPATVRRLLAALQSAATARDDAGVLQVWSLAGELPRALSLAAIVWAGQPEITIGTDDDCTSVRLLWIEIDPEVDRIVLAPDPPPPAEAPADLGDAAAEEAAARLDAAAEVSGL